MGSSPSWLNELNNIWTFRYVSYLTHSFCKICKIQAAIASLKIQFEHIYILELRTVKGKGSPFQNATKTCRTVRHAELKQERALNRNEYLSDLTWCYLYHKTWSCKIKKRRQKVFTFRATFVQLLVNFTEWIWFQPSTCVVAPVCIFKWLVKSLIHLYLLHNESKKLRTRARRVNIVQWLVRSLLHLYG